MVTKLGVFAVFGNLYISKTEEDRVENRKKLGVGGRYIKFSAKGF